jgi:hypothetical protein
MTKRKKVIDKDRERKTDVLIDRYAVIEKILKSKRKRKEKKKSKETKKKKDR